MKEKKPNGKSYACAQVTKAVADTLHSPSQLQSLMNCLGKKQILILLRNNPCQPPPPSLYSNHLRQTVSSHPRENALQKTVPLPPSLLCKGRATQNKKCKHEDMSITN